MKSRVCWMFMSSLASLGRRGLPAARGTGVQARPQAAAPSPETIQIQIHHGRRVERQHLADDEPAYDRDTERLAHLGPITCVECEWQRAEHGRKGSHHD